MKLPESTLTMRSAGSSSSSRLVSVRGSMNCPSDRSSKSTWFQSIDSLMRAATACRAVALAGLHVSGDERLEHVGGALRRVPDDTQVDRPVGAQGLLLEVDLDDLGAGADQVPVAHGPHVQRAAEPDDEIGVGDQFGRERGGESAGDAEVEVVLVEQALGHGRGRHQRTGVLRPGPGSRPGPRARRVRPRTPGAGRRPAARPGHCTEAREGRIGSAGAMADRRSSLVVGDILRLDVQRQVQHHRPAVVHRAAVGADGVRDGATGPSARARAPRRRRRQSRPGPSRSSSTRPRAPPRRRARSSGCGTLPPRRCRSPRWSARSPGARRAVRPGRWRASRRRPWSRPRPRAGPR